MIKAIIFDCFGVLSSDNWEKFLTKHLIGNEDKVRRATEFNTRSDKGEFTYDEWTNCMAEIAGIPESQVLAERHENVDNEQLLEYVVTTLKPHYKIAILSNVGKGFRVDMFAQWRHDIFNDVILSCDTGLAKPDLAAFRLAAERLGVETHECVFVDDKQHNIDAAEHTGMRAIRYDDFAQFTRKLEEVLS